MLAVSALHPHSFQQPLVSCWGVRTVQPYEWPIAILLWLWLFVRFKGRCTIKSKSLLPVLPVPIVVRPLFFFPLLYLLSGLPQLVDDATGQHKSAFFFSLALLTCRTFRWTLQIGYLTFWQVSNACLNAQSTAFIGGFESQPLIWPLLFAT